jgi:hypothetical protein
MKGKHGISDANHWCARHPVGSRARYLTALAALGCSLLITALHATDCVEISQKDAFRAASIVFRGKVVRVEDATEEVNPVDVVSGKLVLQRSGAGGTRIVTFAVSRTWKGSPNSEMQLLTLERPAMFVVGVEYIVYGLDEVNQQWAKIRRFSERSKVYGIGFPCVLRVRTDVEIESRRLERSKAAK